MKTLLLAAALAVLAQAPADLEKSLKSKEYDARLAAVEALIKDTDPKTEKLLFSAVRDDDWEVALRAVEGLGERKVKGAVDVLMKLALEAPIRRVRIAAARSLREIAPDDVATTLVRRISGNDAVPALEALAIVLAGRESPVDLAPVAKLAEKGKDSGARAAAGAVVGAANWKERERAFAKLIGAEAVRPACAALDAAARSPRASDLTILLDLFAKPELDDCVERRLVEALRALFASSAAKMDEAGIVDTLGPLAASKVVRVAARAAVLIESASTAVPVPNGAPVPALLTPPKALSLLAPLLDHADATPRALAVRALERIGGPEALAVAQKAAANDKAPRVRRAAFLSACALAPISDASNLALAVQLLQNDADPDVRRTAAVKLGVRELSGSVVPLIAALEDKDWGVGVCAAVSLGLSQSAAAVDPLATISKSHTDWKMRAAAVIGLSHLYLKPAIPHVIEAIGDVDPFVVRCAHVQMMVVSKEKYEAKREPWREWWEKNQNTVRLLDPVVASEFRKRFGSTTTVGAPRVLTDSDFVEIFRDQDVVVLESTGDHIQNLLTRQKLDHRLTTAGKITADGLSGHSLFVANCTGEIETPDVERLRWFVLAGGNLFGSCWALHETIAKALPGPMQKFETRSEVLATVEAFACRRASEHLAGVFAPGVQPLYALEGAHVIEVLEPERVEVLIDSPECAETFGGGNLCAWFSAGHGTVMDSANHFAAQGLTSAAGAQKPIERQAYAVDHMGLTFEKLRSTKSADWWSNSEKASREITDLSVFRLVTNFVRLRRLER